MFFHVDAHKYLNLISKFLLSCNHLGDYMADVPIPKTLIFIPNGKIERNLRQCRDERNTPKWFVYCKSSCEMFKINTIEPFFEPDLSKYDAFYKFLRD